MFSLSSLRKCLVFASLLLAAGQSAPALELQPLIDAAVGPVVQVPAGVYEGPVRLPEGVFLVGAGADSTKLVLPASGPGVVGLNQSAILGFTLSGGATAVATRGRFMGVFECRFEGQTNTAISCVGGSAVVAHNRLAGLAAHTVGVYVSNANPVLLNNEISAYTTGVLLEGNLIPLVQENLFAGNQTAVLASGDAQARLVRNVFLDNEVNGVGAGAQQAAEQDLTDPGTLKIGLTGTVEQYRHLMQSVYESAFDAHMSVTYTLGLEAGSFGVRILSPVATFSIASSSVGTQISAVDAYDRQTGAALAAQLQPETQPRVDVVNPGVSDKAIDRFVLDNRYQHADSYALNDKGQWVFRRFTNISRIIVLLPSGWQPVAISHPATLSQTEDGQVAATILNPGGTVLEMTLANR